MELNPEARKYEFTNLLNFIDINKKGKVLDIPSGGGYLRKYLPETFYITCAEETNYFYEKCAENFSQNKIRYEKDKRINLEAETFDLVISVAGLHHLQKKNWIVSEMSRLLKNKGKIIIADVVENSKEARFLNEFVDQNNSYGHKGVFLDTEFDKLLVMTGFDLQFSNVIHYNWEFDSTEMMSNYCKNLFGIDKCNQAEILAGIKKYLDYTLENDKVKMNWSLKYISAVKI